jgi:hypothetical protein
LYARLRRHSALFCATLRMERTTDGFEIDCFAVRLAARRSSPARKGWAG